MGRIIPYIMEKNMFQTTNQISVMNGQTLSVLRVQQYHIAKDCDAAWKGGSLTKMVGFNGLV